jgi:hypothetical protein
MGKFKLNSEGVREMLRSQEILEACRSEADRIAATAGDGYEVSEYTGTNRVNVSVGAVTQEAIKDNLENNTLLKAAGS